MKTNRIETVGTAPNEIALNLDYWDCECEHDYIRPTQKAGVDQGKAECLECGACEDDHPPSRADEVETALADPEGWPSAQIGDHYQFTGWVHMPTKIDVLATSEEEARKIANRVFTQRVRDMYHANIGADETVFDEWYEPDCVELEIDELREYDGESCFTLKSTEDWSVYDDE